MKTADGKVWAFTEKNILYTSDKNENKDRKLNRISLPSSLRKDIPGYENISLFDKPIPDWKLRRLYDLNLEKGNDKDYKININKITKEKINETWSYIDKTVKTDIDYTENNVSFYFGVPLYEKYTERKYQYKLDGLFENWSEWTTSTSTNFKNLSFGNYTFNVRAKVGNKLTENTASYSFSVGRPWYLSNLWIAFYLLLTAFVFATIHTIYRQYYKRQRKEFLSKKEKELERLQLENEKEIMKLRNDKLRADIETKNKELAASTMSIIKKNEFLNNIKKELSQVENKEVVKPVIKIIDKNIDKHGDWELFKKHLTMLTKTF